MLCAWGHNKGRFFGNLSPRGEKREFSDFGRISRGKFEKHRSEHSIGVELFLLFRIIFLEGSKNSLPRPWLHRLDSALRFDPALPTDQRL